MAGIHAVYTLEEPDSAAAQSPQCAHEFKLTTAAVSDATNRPIIGRSLSVTVAAADSDSHSRIASEGGVRDTTATSGFADASAEPEQSKRNPHD